MNKFFKVTSTILLFIFSFYYTNKCVEWLMQKDPLMQEIIERKSEYQIKPIDAIVTSNTIIPGLMGTEINIQESYKKMKSLGSFNESLLVYNKVKPTLSLNNNSYDKIIISGNQQQNKISLIFKVDDEIIFTSINNILKNNNIIGNLLTNQNFNIQNTNYQNVLTTSYEEYSDYCLTTDLLIDKACFENKKFTILSSININKYHITYTKNNISNGSIITYIFNKSNVNTLNTVIKYLLTNNYKIVSIDELLKE